MSMIKPEVFTTSSFFRVCRIPTRKYGIRWNEHCVCLIDGWFSLFFGGGVFSFAAIQIPVLIEHELNMISQLLK